MLLPSEDFDDDDAEVFFRLAIEAADTGAFEETFAYYGFIVLLTFLGLALFLPGLGRHDLWNPDEPRYMEVAREMAETDEETRRRAESLLESAHERLRYWDITEEQNAELERSNKVIRTLKVFAPSSGVIMKRMPGLEGMAARPGMELLHIADLRNLWLTVEVFEDQLPWVNVGSQAAVTLTYFPGKSIQGKVRFIEPEVSEKSRSVRLTLDVPNRDSRLRVGMYATVLFEPVAAQNALTVPSNAILDAAVSRLRPVAMAAAERITVPSSLRTSAKPRSSTDW